MFYTMSSSKAEASSSLIDNAPNKEEETNYITMLRKKHKLCGFLKKNTGQKVLKTSKSYWFIYAENTCRLIYFDSCNQAIPVGEIDISRASFSLETENFERPGLFHISTPEQNYELEAKDQNSALYWLQELQKHRRRFSTKRNANIKKYGVTFVSHVGNFESGLLKDCASSADEEQENLGPTLEVPINTPQDVGEDSFKSSSHSIFNNLRSQLRNGISNILTKSNEQNLEEYSPTEESKSSFRFGKQRGSIRHSLPFNFGAKEQKDSTKMSSSTSIECIKDFDKKDAEIARLRNCVIEIDMELKATKELVLFLQKQLDIVCRQKESVMKICRDLEGNDQMRIVLQKDVELVQANEKIEQLQNNLEESNSMNLLLRQKYEKLCKSGHLKTEEYFDNYLVTSTPSQTIFSDLADKEDVEQWTIVERKSYNDNEIERIKDELQAFKFQNRFLNSEILQLNLLRQDSEEREALTRTTCIEWEAKYYAIQSKYMVLLNEFHTPSISRPPDAASQLLHDAIKDINGPDYLSISKVIGSDSRYDIYGFLKSSASTVDLLQGASILKLRADGISGQLKNNYDGWLNKWDGFMTNFSSRPFQPSLTLKELIRTGVPFIYRSAVWKNCINYHVKHIRSATPKNYYETLLVVKKQGSVTVTAEKQIELDLLRTLPHNKHFETAHSDGLPKLRRVLIAYSRHNEFVGYCQGLNRLAAVALLFLSEEDAFWCLVAIVDVLMPFDYYTRDLVGTQVDQLVLKELLLEKSPRLFEHLNQHSIDVSLFTFHWFMCIFVDCLPVETFLCIWDVFLNEGNKVLFRFALAILKLFEEDCMKVNDSVGVSETLRGTMEKLDDWQKLAQVAFDGLNPFPRKMIVHKREQHLPVVKQEVEKLNRERDSIYTRYLPRKSTTNRTFPPKPPTNM